MAIRKSKSQAWKNYTITTGVSAPSRIEWNINNDYRAFPDYSAAVYRTPRWSDVWYVLKDFIFRRAQLFPRDATPVTATVGDMADANIQADYRFWDAAKRMRRQKRCRKTRKRKK